MMKTLVGKILIVLVIIVLIKKRVIICSHLVGAIDKYKSSKDVIASQTTENLTEDTV